MMLVRRVSECFIKPQHELSQDPKQPIYLTPYELTFLHFNYSQKGLLFAKPPPDDENQQDFSITAFLDDLRHSLSATLTHFYPLAARLATKKLEEENAYVIYIDPEINSPGVKFVHAATVDNVTVSDILAPDDDAPLVVHSFFDLNDVTSLDGHTQPLLSVQVTELTDGVFIGCSVNHLLADATSFWHFMAVWSEILRSEEYQNNADNYFISRPPVFNQGRSCNNITPIKNLPVIQSIENHDDQVIKERFFHFTAAAVSKLKAKANRECNSQMISSLQAVSALLWRCITRVRHQPNNGETVCKLAFNNRGRVNPPFCDNYFGSPVDLVRGSAMVGDLMVNGLGWAALRVHEAVKTHQNAAVKKWADQSCYCPSVAQMKRNELYHPNNVLITSSPRFDMYGCEFGLGKAVASRTGSMNKGDGKMIMYPGREGGGSMDVEVCLLPQCMMDLECDEEFVSALKSN